MMLVVNLLSELLAGYTEKAMGMFQAQAEL